jgi:hypothetical protein
MGDGHDEEFWLDDRHGGTGPAGGGSVAAARTPQGPRRRRTRQRGAPVPSGWLPGSIPPSRSARISAAGHLDPQTRSSLIAALFRETVNLRAAPAVRRIETTEVSVVVVKYARLGDHSAARWRSRRRNGAGVPTIHVKGRRSLRREPWHSHCSDLLPVDEHPTIVDRGTGWQSGPRTPSTR